MARFLLVTYPMAGHVAPAAPIVRALCEYGHDVLWMTGTRFEHKVLSTGAHYVPLPASIDPGDRDIYDYYPELKARQGLAQVKWYAKHIFIDSILPTIDALEAALAQFPAEVLIADSVMPGVFFYSEQSGIPSAMISDVPLCMLSRDTAPPGLGLTPGTTPLTKARDRALNVLIHQVLLKDVTDYANTVRAALQLPPYRTPAYRAYFEQTPPHLILQCCPPAFEYPRSDLPETCRFIGPVLPPPNPESSLPPWWPEVEQAQRVILINQGTVATNVDELIVPAMEGLQHDDVLVVAVPVQPGAVRRIPGNARTAPFIPFNALLPHVDVMITNGGYGATQWALAHGIPLVIAGATEDKMEVAARVEWSGSGINLRKKRPIPQEFRAAVQRVLEDERYQRQARRLQAEIAGYDAPQRAVALLEQLVPSDVPQYEIPALTACAH